MSDLKEENRDLPHDNDDCNMDIEIKHEPLENEISNNKMDDDINQETTSNGNNIMQKSVYKDTDVVIKEEVRNVENDEEKKYVKEIKNALDSVTGLGTFACGGVLENAQLQLHVKGMGNINLPLSEKDAKALKTKCTAAPFGRGSETLVHKRVRDAWQVDAKDVSLDLAFSSLIKEKLHEIIPNLTGESYSDSSMCNSVEAELYKLVYYERGGHFLAHRDTEKGPGMFATLVIQLPAGHKGGALVLRHKGDTKIFAYEDDSKSKYFFTAFFADCEHELQRVESGHRLVLIYNLIRNNSFPRPINETKPNKNDLFLNSMKQSVEHWKCDDKGPDYLALKLDHLYTKANISFQNLKGKDKTVAKALCSCEDIEVYLVTLTKLEHRMGYDDEPRGYGYDSEPELYDLEEWKDDIDLKESSYTLNNWIGIHDNIKHFGKFDLNKNERLSEEDMFPKDERSIRKKDRKLFEDSLKEIKSEYTFKAEYTGNAGCNVEYFYKKTGIVFFPKSHEILISCEYNFHTNLATCKKLAKTNVNLALSLLQGIFRFIKKKHNRAMIQLYEFDDVAVIFEILILFEHETEVIKSLANNFIEVLVNPYQPEERYYSKVKVGLPTINSAIALANLIKKLGWESLETSILKLINECAVTHTISCAQFVSCMLSQGRHEQAKGMVELVASQMINEKEEFASDHWALWAVLMASYDTFATCFDTIFQEVLKMKDTFMIRVVAQMLESLQPNVINQCKMKSCFQTVTGILKDKGWKSLSVEAVLNIWPIVLFVDKLNHDTSPIHSLVQTIIEHENSSEYLQKLLKLGDNVEEKDHPSVQLLVGKRLEQLRNISKPIFSWAQPEATVVYESSRYSYYSDSSDEEEVMHFCPWLLPHRNREPAFEPSKNLLKDVQNFLRGNQESKTFGGFEKRSHVKQFGNKLFLDGWHNQLKNNYSAKYVIFTDYDCDEDKHIYSCHITKSKKLFEEKESLYNKMYTEAKTLKETYYEPEI